MTARADHWAVWLTLLLCVLAFVLGVVFMPAQAKPKRQQTPRPTCRKHRFRRAPKSTKPRRWRCWLPVGTNDQLRKTMSNDNTALTATRQQFDLSPQTFDQALTFSKYLADSDLVPKDFKGRPGNCLVAIQWGAELGLKPLQAMQNLAVINGRPALWGDAVIALVRSSPLCEYVVETDDGGTATCKVKRRNEPEQVRTFSMDDARAAGLAGKQGPWAQYPKRMRQMRARAFALRDVFPDVLRGLPVAEEVMDTPTEKHMGPAEVVTPPATPKSYDPVNFERNLPKWTETIESGRKTAKEYIDFAVTRGEPFTEEQKARLLSVKKAPAQQAHEEAQDVQVKQPPSDAPAVTYADLAGRLRNAQSPDELDEVATMIGAVENPQHRQELTAIYEDTQDSFA